ncbi:hydroxysqualene dehydroxylase HpnE [Rhodospirillum sp. A1_3_36]|uniref:hydroxysqualene dehydroxylase HpnE n=1 Tax=Rhodospirillum sp. A1_3_36 TaxID=3391666 RepID=UPI0039A77846
MTEARSAAPSRRVHVVGAGMAGLACAVRLTAKGVPVSLWEGAGQAGGRCRSFHDATLDRHIDNGNHLLLSGNRAVGEFLATIGAPADVLAGPERASFPFLDLSTGERWVVRPSAGLIPWWVFSPRTRIPGTAIGEYLAGIRLARAKPGDTIAELFDTGSPLYKRFWEPLTIAALNTDPEEAAAELLWPVIQETFGKGEAACRPRYAPDGLSAAFVDPALAWLAGRGAKITLKRRLSGVEFQGDRVGSLLFGSERVVVEEGEAVVLALPPAGVAGLLPDLDLPDQYRAIVNVHYRLDHAPKGFVSPLGILGGTAEWLFVRGDIASVTVSAADALAEVDAGEVIARVWRDVARALNLDPASPAPLARVIKEKRATFAQTPGQVAKRPEARTRWRNLALAGDWTNTGLPATIEGAMRSGESAAVAVDSR